MNHVSLDEALKGQLARDSVLPGNLPGGRQCKDRPWPLNKAHGRGSAGCSSLRRALLSRARQQAVALLCLASLFWIQEPSWAQDAPTIQPVRPQVPVIIRPYLPVTVPPIRLANSPRLQELVRAGMLYLTAQDAIALALENNIDIEVSRYNPFISRMAAGALASGRRIAGSAQWRVASRIGRQRPRRRRKPGRRRSKRAGREFQRSTRLKRHHFADRSGHSEPGSDCAGDHHLQPYQLPAAGPGAKRGAQPDTEHARVHRKLSARPAHRRHRHGQLQRALLERKRTHRCAESHRRAQRQRFHPAQFAARLRRRRRTPAPSRCRA